jgi:hypothetical protein
MFILIILWIARKISKCLGESLEFSSPGLHPLLSHGGKLLVIPPHKLTKSALVELSGV